MVFVSHTGRCVTSDGQISDSRRIYVCLDADSVVVLYVLCEKKTLINFNVFNSSDDEF